MEQRPRLLARAQPSEPVSFKDSSRPTSRVLFRQAFDDLLLFLLAICLVVGVGVIAYPQELNETSCIGKNAGDSRRCRRPKTLCSLGREPNWIYEICGCSVVRRTTRSCCDMNAPEPKGPRTLTGTFWATEWRTWCQPHLWRCPQEFSHLLRSG